jgi:hypothetical protein
VRRAAALALLLLALVLVTAPAAFAAESYNPWDRPEEPLDTGPSGDPTARTPTAQEDAEAADRCSSVGGLPANIGCRLLAGGIGAATGGVTGALASSAFDGFVDAVADGAIWFLSKVASFLDSSTRPPLTQPWFTDSYQTMIALSAIVVLPLVLLAIVDAVVHARPGQIVRTLLLYLPLAGIVSYVALELVDLLVTVTDWMAAFISGGVAADSAQFLEGMGSVLAGAGEELPAFAVFMGGIFAIFGAFLLWIELIVRDAGISLSVLFLPLAFATMVWPRIARWASRALRTLAALLLSKVFIVATISLGASMLSGVGAGAGLESVVAGVALLGLATFAPWVLWRLLAPVEGALEVALEGAARLPMAAAGRGRAATAMAGGASPRVAGAGAGGPLPVAGMTAGGRSGGAMLGAVAAAEAARQRAGPEGSPVGRLGADMARRRSAAAAGGTTQGSGNGGSSSSTGSGGGGASGSAQPAPAPAPATTGAQSNSGGPLPVRKGEPPPPPPAASPPPPAPPPPSRRP